MTNAIPPFAYGHDGALLVSSDGLELLVCAGPDEGPMWRRSADATITGVGSTARAVVAVDDKGHVLACNRESGEILWEADAGIEAAGLCTSRAGAIAVFGSAGVVIVDGDGRTSKIDVSGATCAALDPDGERIGVGTDQGDYCVFDVATGNLLGKSRASSPFKGTTWNVRRFFIATTGEGVVKITADGGEIQNLINTEDLVLSAVSCSQDGSLVALRVGAFKAAVFDLVDYQFQGVAHYERTVGQVDFGPGAWLGIGLDLGDGNKIDLLTNAVCRTDPHPGRKRNTWMLLADFKAEQIQRVMDRVHHGAAIAARGPSRRAPAMATPGAQAVAPPSSGSPMLFAVIAGIMAVVVILLLVLR